MGLSNNGGVRAPAGYLLSPNEAFSSKNGSHLISGWPKRPHMNLQGTQAISLDCFLKLMVRSYC